MLRRNDLRTIVCTCSMAAATALAKEPTVKALYCWQGAKGGLEFAAAQVADRSPEGDGVCRDVV
jgi:hypothetical protein